MNPTISYNPVASKKSNSDQKFGCLCQWDQCEFVSEQFSLYGNINHPWRGNSLNWTSSKSTIPAAVLKNKLFRAGILHGLQIPENLHDRYKSRMRIARHHFPLRIWKEIKSIKALNCIINTEVAKRIDENITHNRLSDYKHSVKFLLTKIDLSEKKQTRRPKIIIGRVCLCSNCY